MSLLWWAFGYDSVTSEDEHSAEEESRAREEYRQKFMDRRIKLGVMGIYLEEHTSDVREEDDTPFVDESKLSKRRRQKIRRRRRELERTTGGSIEVLKKRREDLNAEILEHVRIRIDPAGSIEDGNHPTDHTTQATSVPAWAKEEYTAMKRAKRPIILYLGDAANYCKAADCIITKYERALQALTRDFAQAYRSDASYLAEKWRADTNN